MVEEDEMGEIEMWKKGRRKHKGMKCGGDFGIYPKLTSRFCDFSHDYDLGVSDTQW